MVLFLELFLGSESIYHFSFKNKDTEIQTIKDTSGNMSTDLAVKITRRKGWKLIILLLFSLRQPQ